jgi:hypothetical protein
MLTRRSVHYGCTIVLMLAGFACDKPVEAKKDDPAPQEPVEAMNTVEARVDLQGVVDIVASGEVDSAAALEAKLEPTAETSPMRVDIDADGKVDPVRIVEVRGEKSATFELRAVPSTEPEVAVEAAPLVATLELQADANVGEVKAVASLDASFKAVARISSEASASASASFTGIGVSAEGSLEVKAEANAFVSWAFEAERPRYVAEVFIAKAEKPEPDPCWPPGHCKHGLWKATPEDDKPGNGRDDDDEHGRDHDKDKDDKAKGDKDKPEKAEKKPDDKGKSKADDKSKSNKDEGKPSSKSSSKGDTGQPGKPGKGDTGQPGNPKSEGGKSKGK